MRRSGLSLLELVVAMALLFLVAFAGLWMLICGRNIVRSAVGRSSWSRDFYQVCHRLSEMLEEAPRDSYTVITPGPQQFASSFLSARNNLGVYQTNFEGDPDWQAYLILYWQAGQLRQRRSLLAQAPGSSLAWPPAQLSQNLTSLQPPLLRQVDSFSLTLQDQGVLLQLRASSDDGSYSSQWQRRILCLR